ncbi:cinnamoyl-CoA reductase 1-like, partial [Amborella trichopoda]
FSSVLLIIRSFYFFFLSSDAGSPTYVNESFGWVNVKDVAEAHILAYEVPSASGRYCMVERILLSSEIVKLLHELYPEYPVPQNCADENPFPSTYQVSKEKAQKLGVNFTPFEVSLKETVESLKEKKFF